MGSARHTHSPIEGEATKPGGVTRIDAESEAFGTSSQLRL